MRIFYVGSLEFDDVLPECIVDWTEGVERGLRLTRNKVVIAALQFLEEGNKHKRKVLTQGGRAIAKRNKSSEESEDIDLDSSNPLSYSRSTNYSDSASSSMSDGDQDDGDQDD